MNREKEVQALLERSKEQLVEIRSEYEKSLHEKNITDLLKVNIKNLCENLRSVLDYLAHTIRETHCPSVNTRDRFYFPILPDLASFNAQVNRCFPGLDQANSSLFSYLESIQPFQDGCDWLGNLNKVNNKNKHGDLATKKWTQS